jgi:sarcosine oxidase
MKDVIIIGLGSMGSAASYYLSKAGYSVLGLEQFDLVHEKGSHSGQSRIIRMSYFEHPNYVDLLKRAYQSWEELEQIGRKKLFYKTGVLYVGTAQSEVLSGVQNSAKIHQLNIQTLSHSELKSQYPAFSIPEGMQGIFEANAGFVLPESSIEKYCQLAIENGAECRSNCEVYSWQCSNDGVVVNTSQGEFKAKKLVITAGAYTQKLIPGLSEILCPTIQTLSWKLPEKSEIFELGNFPCWLIDDPDQGVFYGFPNLENENLNGPKGIKIGHHVFGNKWDFHSSYDVSLHMQESIRYALRKYLPKAGYNTEISKTCLYTYSPDENFIIDILPETGGKVCLAAGFSGHGFKFIPVVGEILKDLCLYGKTVLPIAFLKLDRFRKKLGNA